MRFIVYLLLVLNMTISACAQVPADRPPVETQAFDQKLTKLLSFDVPVIGVKELYEQRDQYVILDTREAEEYEVSHIEGAKLLGYKKLDESVLESIPKDQPIVLYCSVGYRSEKMGKELQKRGFQKVYNLYGSIFEWMNQSYPVVDRQGNKTRQVHTYNEKWSQWVDAQKVERVW